MKTVDEIVSCVKVGEMHKLSFSCFYDGTVHQEYNAIIHSITKHNEYCYQVFYQVGEWGAYGLIVPRWYDRNRQRIVDIESLT
jgi:hypothetical protein